MRPPPPPPPPDTNATVQTFSFDFATSDSGWAPGFADYPAGQEQFFRLAADYRRLPAPLDTLAWALFLSGDNHSDDLFMFFKHRVSGLRPNATYRVAFAVQVGTNAPAGCAGEGGSPGEGVWVKAGASALEPAVAIDSTGVYRLTIDKGVQSGSGANAVVLGDLASDQQCGQGPPRYELKDLASGPDSVEVTADTIGAAWLMMGTDSGFEGQTSVYFTRYSSTFVPH